MTREAALEIAKQNYLSMTIAMTEALLDGGPVVVRADYGYREELRRGFIVAWFQIEGHRFYECELV